MDWLGEFVRPALAESAIAAAYSPTYVPGIFASHKDVNHMSLAIQKLELQAHCWRAARLGGVHCP